MNPSGSVPRQTTGSQPLSRTNSSNLFEDATRVGESPGMSPRLSGIAEADGEGGGLRRNDSMMSISGLLPRCEHTRSTALAHTHAQPYHIPHTASLSLLPTSLHTGRAPSSKSPRCSTSSTSRATRRPHGNRRERRQWTAASTTRR